MAETEDGVAESRRLDVFCVQIRSGAWRIYVHPGWVPQYLKKYFNDDWEAVPRYLDFEDLDRHLREQDAVVEKTVSKRAAFQMVACGQSAEALAMWLAGAFATAPTDDGSSESATSTDADNDEQLRKLRDGETSREEYLDTAVERGLDHLRGRLSARQPQIVRLPIDSPVRSTYQASCRIPILPSAKRSNHLLNSSEGLSRKPL